MRFKDSFEKTVNPKQKSIKEDKLEKLKIKKEDIALKETTDKSQDLEKKIKKLLEDVKMGIYMRKEWAYLPNGILSREIFDELLEQGEYIVLLDNNKKFKDFPLEKLFATLLREDKLVYFANKLRFFDDLPIYMAEILLNKGFFDQVISNINSFKYLNKYLIENIISRGALKSIIPHMYRFPRNVFNKEFLEDLLHLEDEGASYFELYIDRFEENGELNNDVADLLYRVGHGDLVLKYFSHFHDVDAKLIEKIMLSL